MLPRLIALLAILLTPISSEAHVGHLVDAAGHDHLLAGAAIGIAIAIGVAGALKGRADDSEPREDDSSGEDPELSEA